MTSTLHTVNFTPREIVHELDKYIVGQNEAKRTVAIALRNRWRRMNSAEDIRREISPNNILMIGSTGIGKTEIARRLAKIADAPFVKVEASKFTEVGYVGRDVESMVRDLVEQAVNMVKLRLKEELKEKATAAVEDRIIDLLVPAPDHKFPENEEQEQYQRTREWMREKLRRGEMNERKIEINVRQNQMPGVGVIGGPMGGIDESSMMNIQEMISGMMPKQNKKRKLTVADAYKVLLDEEVSKMIDMDEVKEEAVKKTENLGMIFIDEIDKIAKSSDKGGADVSREGVQRDLLPIVEGSAVNTKYGIVNTDHILFIAAGAFHFSKPSDMIPELQGRFPIRVELEKLTVADFYRILTEPANALTKQYAAMLASENVTIEFEEDSLRSIAEIAFQVNNEVENIGARRLQTVMARLLNEFLFDVPDSIPGGSKLVITKKMVTDKLSDMVKDKDLSRYIL